MSSKPVILVVDDEPQMRRLLQLTLETNGFDIHTASTGNEGVVKVASERPELVILDLGLPDMDGSEVLKKIREWSTVPVLVLSVRSAEEDIVGCLDAGADDYLVKPFRTGELLARVRAALRHRLTPEEKVVFVSHGLSVDLSSRVVRKGDEIVKLTATEYALLALFVKNAGRVLTHRFILEQVWGPSHAEETQYTRVYVGQLRKKIEDDPSDPTLLLTESGIGYRLAVDE
jgi:two-component system, OmpR family, KDP operon response regulator KdpE